MSRHKTRQLDRLVRLLSSQRAQRCAELRAAEARLQELERAARGPLPAGTGDRDKITGADLRNLQRVRDAALGQARATAGTIAGLRQEARLAFGREHVAEGLRNSSEPKPRRNG